MTSVVKSLWLTTFLAITVNCETSSSGGGGDSSALGSCRADNNLMCINYGAMPGGASMAAQVCEAGSSTYSQTPCSETNKIAECSFSDEGFVYSYIFYTGASQELIGMSCP